MLHDKNGYGKGDTNTLLISLPHKLSLTTNVPKL